MLALKYRLIEAIKTQSFPKIYFQTIQVALMNPILVLGWRLRSKKLSEAG